MKEADSPWQQEVRSAWQDGQTGEQRSEQSAEWSSGGHQNDSVRSPRAPKLSPPSSVLCLSSALSVDCPRCLKA